jgi:hypothetical protein
MNTSKDYAAQFRIGAEILLDSPDAIWWQHSVSGNERQFSWLEGIVDKEIEFTPNDITALFFLFLAAALDAGDL